MAQSNRILFVAGEVTPFAATSSIASLVRVLPEQLRDAGDFEARVMMPCYETIDEREHNLHEVIRLSGTEVPMGDDTETLTVKVASVPDTRLQVYFMDHASYFQSNELIDGHATPEAIVRQALFFNRAAFETIRKLRWGPDLIHSFGWMGGLGPLLLSTDYGEEDLLNQAKSVFTPDENGPDIDITSALTDGIGRGLNGTNVPSFVEAGVQNADISIYPPTTSPTSSAPQFVDDASQRGPQLAALYDEMLSEVSA